MITPTFTQLREFFQSSYGLTLGALRSTRAQPDLTPDRHTTSRAELPSNPLYGLYGSGGQCLYVNDLEGLRSLWHSRNSDLFWLINPITIIFLFISTQKTTIFINTLFFLTVYEKKFTQMEEKTPDEMEVAA